MFYPCYLCLMVDGAVKQFEDSRSYSRGLRPHRGVKPLRGSSTSLVPRSVAALRVSAPPSNCEM
jgi:hypothetical protein